MALINLSAITNALSNDEFIFYYQPKVSLISGKICGAEALIRWIKPDGSIIPPDSFIPLAEQTGFINNITLSMFQKLIVDMNILHDIDASLKISFNASAKDFLDNKLVEAIRLAIEHKLISADQLEVEITETVIISEIVNSRLNMQALHDMGVALVMDDYGIGFSSIDTLAKWPFSSIKLDKGIITQLDTSCKEFTIVQSSIHMAHQLELGVVAEGIETEEVYQILQNMGCLQAQGYWISRPLPLTDFIELCRQNKQWPVDPVGLLHMAQLDHIQWRKAIIDGSYYLRQRKDSDKVRGAPESDPTACRLGRWYYGSGKYFAGSTCYDQLEEPHNRLHEIGTELLNRSKQDAPKDEITSLMRQLTEQSMQVISLLQQMENAIFTKSIRFSPEKK